MRDFTKERVNRDDGCGSVREPQGPRRLELPDFPCPRGLAGLWLLPTPAGCRPSRCAPMVHAELAPLLSPLPRGLLWPTCVLSKLELAVPLPQVTTSRFTDPCAVCPRSASLALLAFFPGVSCSGLAGRRPQQPCPSLSWPMFYDRDTMPLPRKTAFFCKMDISFQTWL